MSEMSVMSEINEGVARLFRSPRVRHPNALARCFASVMLCGLLLGLVGCAARGVQPTLTKGTLENPSAGVAVKLATIADLREFQHSDSRTLTPSLTGDINDPDRLARVVGRGTTQTSRPGPNIFVAADLTVEGLVRTATERALRQAGFRVLQKEDSGYDAAIAVGVDIEKFWMMQSRPTESPSTEIEMEVRLSGPLPGLDVGRVVKVHERVVRGGFNRSMWRQVLELGLDEYVEAAEIEMEYVLAAIDTTPASQLALSGLTILPSDMVPGKSGIDFGRYHLLAIGIDAYESLPRLKTAVSDAKAVARLLGDAYGFETKLLLDATRADLIQAFSEYRAKLGPRDNLLIYYAGHGWNDEDAGLGYWLPVDADRDDETNWVSNSKITSILRAMQAKHVMVVSDSCYSGTLTRGIQLTRSGPGHLERLAERRTRVALASGGNEPVQDGGGGEHSVFANAFLRILGDNSGVLDATQLHALIRNPVMRDSDQTPQFGPIRTARHEDGDFLFVREP